ncbi:MAG: sterol desaturase family protein [Myxococcales bacterium]
MGPIFHAAFFAIGLGHQLVSKLIPFRRQSGPREIRLDAIAVVLFLLLGAGYDRAVSGPLSEWWTSLAAVERWYAMVEEWPPLLVLAVSLVCADFMVYWTHRALHSNVLWHAHAFHHSSKHVWWLAGLRSSPVHAVLTALPDTLAVLLFPPTSEPWLTALILFQFCNQHWIHSNIRLPYQGMLEKLFVTPRVHFVHHSADVRFTNTNYAFLFTLWDRAFGTFTDPELVPLDEQLGLDYENTPWRMMLGLPPSQPKPDHRASSDRAEQTIGGRHALSGGRACKAGSEGTHAAARCRASEREVSDHLDLESVNVSQSRATRPS